MRLRLFSLFQGSIWQPSIKGIGNRRRYSGPEISLTWTIHVLPIMRCIVCNLELCSRRWVYIAQIFFVFCSLIRKDWTHFILLLPKCNLPYMHCLYGKNPCSIQCKFIVKWFHTIVGSKTDQISKEILTFLQPSQKEQKMSHLLFVYIKSLFGSFWEDGRKVKVL